MIHAVVGTKAQMVKMAPLLARLQSRGIPYNFIFTGQHRETMEDLRENFGVKPPDVILYEGRDITSVSAMIVWGARILWRARRRRPDPFRGDRRGLVLTHGDTFSCLLGAILGRAAGMTVASTPGSIAVKSRSGPALVRTPTRAPSSFRVDADVASPKVPPRGPFST